MRIPTGNFGNVAPQPQQGVRAPQGLGSEGYNALARTGQQLQDVAMGAMADQRREEEKTAAKAEREAEKQKDIQDRTAASVVRVQVQNDLADALDEHRRGVADGTIPKDKATELWQQRSAEILKDRTKDLAPEYAGALGAEFDGMARRGANGITDAVAKRDQQDTRANLITLGEQLQRTAVRDRAMAVKEYDAHLDALGPQAGYTPDEIAKLRQGFRETTAFTEASNLINGSKASLDGVRGARKVLGTDRFADLDPQRRAQLDATLDGYETHILQRNEIEAQRRQRQQEAALSRAQAAFTAAQARSEKGMYDSPEQIAETTRLLSGTPYLSTYRAIQQQTRETGGFAAMPIAQQRTALDQVNAQIATHGATEALVKQRDRLQGIVGAAAKDAKEDPLRAALERGVITGIPPIDTSSIDGLSKSVAARLQSAEAVRAWAGQPVSPLTGDEALQLKKMLDGAPPAQRSAFVATLAQTLGPQASQGLAAQLDPKDRALALAFKSAGDQTTLGRYTSELVLKGQQAKLDGTSMRNERQPEIKESQWSARIATALDGVFADQQTTNEMRDKALLVAHGLAAEAGGQLHANDLTRAVGFAVHGTVVEHNGRKVPLPAGVDADALNQRLRSISPDELARQAPGGKVRAAGVEIPLTDFAKSLPGQQLMPVRPGQFAVLVGGRPVVNAKGDPIVIGVR